MRTMNILLAAALVAAVSIVLSNSYARAQSSGSAEMNNIEKMTVMPDDSSNMARFPENYAPGSPALTCSGKPVGIDTKAYVFGYHRPGGYCATNQVLANGATEAWTCARAYCDTCQVEDITESHPAGPFSGVYGTTSMYCPAK